MVGFVTKHEWRRYLRDGRFRTLMTSVLVLMAFAVMLSLHDYKLTKRQYEEHLELARLNWESQTEKDPHDAAHDGTYVIKPIFPLSIMDKGIRQFSGMAVHLGAHERKQSSLNEAKDYSGMLRFGELNPAFLLIYVLPLLLIFIGYNTFTEEKERQTLRLMLVQNISTRQMTLGKWSALVLLMIAMWLLLFVFTVVGSIAVEGSFADHTLGWFGLAGTYLLYFFIFVNVIVLVSALSRSSAFSLTVLLAIWIVVTLIVPKVSTNLAGWYYPFPSLQTFRENINEDQASGLNGHNFWNEAAQDFQQKVLEEYGVETIEELPVAYGGLLLAEGEKYESEIYTKHFNLLQDQYTEQRNIYRWCSILSPVYWSCNKLKCFVTSILSNAISTDGVVSFPL